MQMQEGFCPKCGKQLQIPEELEEFSCLYCGARLSRFDLIREPVFAVDARKEYDIFLKQALHTAVDYPDAMGRVTRTEFYGFFERYSSECAAPFEALERAALSQEGNREEFLTKAAKKLMDQIEEWFLAQKGWKLKVRRSEILERTKFTIAIFLVPTVRKCAPQIGEVFSQRLREQWLSHHPDSPFELATYEDLAAGFRKRPFCFITTAVCEFRGQPDDCEMLTDFRAFRDGYLMACPDGAALIRSYYDCAPGIVSRIDYCEDRKKTYERLYRQYLAPCHRALRAGDPETCREHYIRMMRELKEEYRLH